MDGLPRKIMFVKNVIIISEIIASFYLINVVTFFIMCYLIFLVILLNL